jgi:cysteine-rich repeat protein
MSARAPGDDYGLPLVALLLAALAGCGGESPGNPCAGVDCSGHGACYTDGFWPLCACEPGYAAVGGTCVGGDGDGGESDAEDAGDRVEVPVGCGDGVVAPTEECDDGNAVDGDGCDSDCTYSCHRATDCDDAEECTTNLCVAHGGGRACTATPVAVGTVCDDSSTCTDPDACNAEGVCTGPPTASDTLCNDGLYCNGADDVCDGAGSCVPISMPPCSISGCVGGCDETTDTCTPAAAGLTCRAAAHQCDAVESCDGTATTCPADAMAPAGTACNDGSDCTDPDSCDGAGTCTGTSIC